MTTEPTGAAMVIMIVLSLSSSSLLVLVVAACEESNINELEHRFEVVSACLLVAASGIASRTLLFVPYPAPFLART